MKSKPRSISSKNQGSDYEEEIKRKEQLIKNLKRDLKTKLKERELKKNQKIKKTHKRRSTNFNQVFLKKKEKEMR